MKKLLRHMLMPLMIVAVTALAGCGASGGGGGVTASSVGGGEQRLIQTSIVLSDYSNTKNTKKVSQRSAAAREILLHTKSITATATWLPSTQGALSSDSTTVEVLPDQPVGIYLWLPPAGSVNLDIKAYDGPDGTGNVISTGFTNISDMTAITSTSPITVSLTGTPATITPAKPEVDFGGTATFKAFDADGTQIISDLKWSATDGTPATFTSNSTNGDYVYTAPASPASPTATITVSNPNDTALSASTTVHFYNGNLPISSLNQMVPGKPVDTVAKATAVKLKSGTDPVKMVPAIEISWKAADFGGTATSYTVYMSDTSGHAKMGGTHAVRFQNLTGTSLTITDDNASSPAITPLPTTLPTSADLLKGKKYYLAVEAHNAGGASALSAEVAVVATTIGGIADSALPLATTPAVSIVAGKQNAVGYVDGVGADARFNYSSGITTDGVNLYIAENGANVIRKMNIATKEVSTLAGSMPGTAGYVNGAASSARFNGPAGLTTDGTNVYIADLLNHVIRKVNIATGEVSTFIGGTEDNRTGDILPTDGSSTTAKFAKPTALATDGIYLYVAEWDNQAIRRVSLFSGDAKTVVYYPYPHTKTATSMTWDFPNYYYPAGITAVRLAGGTRIFWVERKVNWISPPGTFDFTTSAIKYLDVPESGGQLPIASSDTRVNTLIASTDLISGLKLQFAEGLTNDGTYLYIADYNNTRVVKVDNIKATAPFTPTSITTFGPFTVGPRNITTDGTSLYVTTYAGGTVDKAQ